MICRIIRPILYAMMCACIPTVAVADNLYAPGNWPAMSGDRRASQVGDIVTVLVVQAAESSSTMQNNSRRSSDIGGRIQAGPLDESGDITFGGSYAGRGEVRRAERFVTQLTVTVTEILPNGDMVVSGQQNMQINRENTLVAVRGRIRVADFDSDNRVLSNRIADAQINYGGHGFVSRSSQPGLINRIFSFLGLS